MTLISGHPAVRVTSIEGRLRFDVAWPSTDRASPGQDCTLRDVEALVLEVAAAAQRLEGELPGCLAARDLAARKHARASCLPLSPLLAWRAGTLKRRADAAEKELQAKAATRNASAVYVRFALGRATLDAFARLAAAHDALSRARCAWEVTPAEVAVTSAPIPGSTLARSPVSVLPEVPEPMRSPWPGLGVRDQRGAGWTLFPGFVVLHRGYAAGEARLADIKAMRLTAAEVPVAEGGSLPEDATVIDHAWSGRTRGGAPDRRLGNGGSVSVVSYGKLALEGAGDDSRAYLVSDRSAALQFADAFSAFQAALQADIGSGAASGRHASEGWPAEEGEPVVRVPPPPRWGGAHEYTLGLIAALVAAAFVPPGIGTVKEPGPVEVVASNNASKAVVPPEVAQGPTYDAAIGASVHPPASDPAPPAPTREAGRTPPPHGASAPRDRVLIRNGANVRSAPNGGAEVIRTAPSGSRLHVFARSGGWLQVGDTAAWGWVHSSLAELVE